LFYTSHGGLCHSGQRCWTTVIADVCSIPYSRQAPEFNREDIASAVKRHRLCRLGGGLGVRPNPLCIVRMAASSLSYWWRS
ncbi:MAG: hypothetical protein OSB69_19885, partial [Alphaproteobacteria bacterium]|nr:hypothetical protein [Alphaproteobacteria bacterium]